MFTVLGKQSLRNKEQWEEKICSLSICLDGMRKT
jgi:hypothetical protein